MTPDEYDNEIPQSRKNISDSDFREIYNTVWGWYKELQRDKSLWDDQDLVRVVLNCMNQYSQEQRRYAAIFCDEAQDFTRLELQIILRLSVWSKYRLHPPIHSLPFAFAGDPMQTLNPTGFDWESLRANFYEHILSSLDPDGTNGIRSSDRVYLMELQQNYRSTRSIVCSSNLVHLWRKILFNLRDLKPQVPWWSGLDTGWVQKGILGQNMTPVELQQITQSDTIFILPCDRDGELDFLREAEYLRGIFPEVDANKTPGSVYSAIAVKGMELTA